MTRRFCLHAGGAILVLGALFMLSSCGPSKDRSAATVANMAVQTPVSDTGATAYPYSSTAPVTAVDYAPPNKQAGPVRLARFSLCTGDVAWRADPTSEWSAASDNLPIQQGCQVWTSTGGRAELGFDDGSALRMGPGSLVTLKTLYSDPQGEYTLLNLNSGLATLVTRHAHSVYQVDTPICDVDVNGASQVRISAGNGVDVEVEKGVAVLDGANGQARLTSGEYVDLTSADQPYRVARVQAPDQWDRWNDQRDRYTEADDQYLPPDVNLVSGDLNEYGRWRHDGRYGEVWEPYQDRSWRPYRNGHWVWVNPVGWTWVGDEPWGWAPYHYGTWVRESYGWCWDPGPQDQYWSPAVVSYCDSPSSVVWTPLAPQEVVYPSPAQFTIGFASGNWAAFFSIGQAGVYYPFGSSYCLGRPYNTTVINQVTNNYYYGGGGYYGQPSAGYNGPYGRSYGRYLTTAEYYAAADPPALSRGAFVPVNAYRGAAIAADPRAFAAGGHYRPIDPPAAVRFYRSGRRPALPAQGRFAVAGPGVRPTPVSLTPARQFMPSSPVPAPIAQRALFNAPPPAPVRARMARIGSPAASQAVAVRGAGVQGTAGGTATPRTASRFQAAQAAGPRPRGPMLLHRSGGAAAAGAAALAAAALAARARATLGLPGGGRRTGRVPPGPVLRRPGGGLPSARLAAGPSGRRPAAGFGGGAASLRPIGPAARTAGAAAQRVRPYAGQRPPRAAGARAQARSAPGKYGRASGAAFHAPMGRRPVAPPARPVVRAPVRHSPATRPAAQPYRPAPHRPQFRPAPHRPQFRAPHRPQFRPAPQRPQFRPAPQRPQFRSPQRPQFRPGAQRPRFRQAPRQAPQAPARGGGGGRRQRRRG